MGVRSAWRRTSVRPALTRMRVQWALERTRSSVNGGNHNRSARMSPEARVCIPSHVLSRASSRHLRVQNSLTPSRKRLTPSRLRPRKDSASRKRPWKDSASRGRPRKDHNRTRHRHRRRRARRCSIELGICDRRGRRVSDTACYELATRAQVVERWLGMCVRTPFRLNVYHLLR